MVTKKYLLEKLKDILNLFDKAVINKNDETLDDIQKNLKILLIEVKKWLINQTELSKPKVKSILGNSLKNTKKSITSEILNLKNKIKNYKIPLLKKQKLINIYDKKIKEAQKIATSKNVSNRNKENAIKIIVSNNSYQKYTIIPMKSVIKSKLKNKISS